MRELYGSRPVAVDKSATEDKVIENFTANFDSNEGLMEVITLLGFVMQSYVEGLQARQGEESSEDSSSSSSDEE